jgi:hypothetical protein
MTLTPNRDRIQCNEPAEVPNRHAGGIRNAAIDAAGPR